MTEPTLATKWLPAFQIIIKKDMTVCVLKDFTETETNRIIGMAVEVPKGRVFNIY